MGDQQVLAALGMIGESVMALYGIARLLQSRELGPTQLLPAIESYRSDAASLTGHLGEAFDMLYRATRETPELATAVSTLEPYAMGVARSIGDTFGRRKRRRLGARERLELEQNAERLGSELEGIRAQLELLRAALNGRSVDLALSDVVDGRWRTKPTFVSQRVAVHWDLHEDRSFTGDPRVLWALLEASFRLLSDRGAGQLFVSARSGDNGTVRAEVRSEPPPKPNDDFDGPLELGLGAPLPVELEISSAIAKHLDIGLDIDLDVAQAAGRVTIAL